MSPQVELLQPEVTRLCRQFGVRRLFAFGSATTSDFDPDRSDVDLLVEFDADPAHLFQRYFGLKESFEELFGRSVDLVTEGALRNPHFIEALKRTRRLVYASQGTEAAAGHP